MAKEEDSKRNEEDANSNSLMRLAAEREIILSESYALALTEFSTYFFEHLFTLINKRCFFRQCQLIRMYCNVISATFLNEKTGCYTRYVMIY